MAQYYGSVQTADAGLLRLIEILETDPHEVVNLADDPQYAETLARMKETLQVFQERTDDPWILKREYE